MLVYIFSFHLFGFIYIFKQWNTFVLRIWFIPQIWDLNGNVYVRPHCYFASTNTYILQNLWPDIIVQDKNQTIEIKAVGLNVHKTPKVIFIIKPYLQYNIPIIYALKKIVTWFRYSQDIQRYAYILIHFLFQSA